MIEFVFTVDYEIYGNGVGSLRELVYEPAEELRTVFKRWNARCVFFVEAAELEIIERRGSDPYIGRVREQVRDLHREGFEIGLHLHPQWCRAQWEEGQWHLDYSEYNLCTLPRERIREIVDRSISYLRSVVGEMDFTPVSFRAGNWLFQPTETAASVLAERGIRVDSSVFKGGLQRSHGLDYRSALANGPWWRFSRDVNVSDPHGSLLEAPIYTRMVPFWRMLTGKRIGLQQKSAAAGYQGQAKTGRLGDYLRLRYPVKLDFCRMTGSELRHMVDQALKEDRRDPSAILPIVAIGHTKDLCESDTISSLLSRVRELSTEITTLRHMAERVCQS